MREKTHSPRDYVQTGVLPWMMNSSSANSVHRDLLSSWITQSYRVNSAPQRQKAVSAYLYSKQILPFGVARQNSPDFPQTSHLSAFHNRIYFLGFSSLVFSISATQERQWTNDWPSYVYVGPPLRHPSSCSFLPPPLSPSRYLLKSFVFFK